MSRSKNVKGSVKMEKTKDLRLIFIVLPLMLICATLFFVETDPEKTDRAYTAVCAPQAGYMGAVTVYDDCGAPVYKWYSATGIPLAADVSPDGEHLAVVCAASGKSAVHIFSLQSEDEQASRSYADELFFGIAWISDEKLCVLSEKRACAISADGKKCGEYDYRGLCLVSYEIGDGGMELILRSHESGGNVIPVSLDPELCEKSRE